MDRSRSHRRASFRGPLIGLVAALGGLAAIGLPATAAPPTSNGRLALSGSTAEPDVTPASGAVGSGAIGSIPANPDESGSAGPGAPADVAPDRSADLAAEAARRADFASRPLGGSGLEAFDGPAGAVETAAADAPTAGGAPSWLRLGGASEFLRVGLSLGVVLAIALVLKRVVDRLGGAATGGRPSGVLETLARYPVGRGRQLLVLRLGRRIVLTHQSGADMRTITEITDPNEVAGLIASLEAGANRTDADRFRTLLADLENGRQPLEPAPTAPPSPIARTGGGARQASTDDQATRLDAAAERVARPRALAALRAASRAAVPESVGGVPVVDLTRSRRGGATTGADR